MQPYPSFQMIRQHLSCLTLLQYFLIPPFSILDLWWSYLDGRGNVKLQLLWWLSHVFPQPHLILLCAAATFMKMLASLSLLFPPPPPPPVMKSNKPVKLLLAYITLQVKIFLNNTFRSETKTGRGMILLSQVIPFAFTKKQRKREKKCRGYYSSGIQLFINKWSLLIKCSIMETWNISLPQNFSHIQIQTSDVITLPLR